MTKDQIQQALDIIFLEVEKIPEQSTNAGINAKCHDVQARIRNLQNGISIGGVICPDMLKALKAIRDAQTHGNHDLIEALKNMVKEFAYIAGAEEQLGNSVVREARSIIAKATGAP